MSMALDKPLDDLVKTSRAAKRKAKTAVKPAAVQSTGPQRNKYTGTRRASGPIAPKPKQEVASTSLSGQDDRKIIVSNLPTDVSEAQIKDLFRETVGELKFVVLSYDSQSRSRGIATVEFKNKGDGTKAFQQYNTRLIDGRKPMKVEIVVDPARAPPPTLASRVAPAPAPAKAPKAPKAAAAAPAANAAATGAGAGTGGRRNRGRKGRGEKKPATVEDLDAEMADYSAAGTGAAPTDAAAAPAA